MTAGQSGVTVYPDGVTRPTTSNLNFVAGQTIPNPVIAPVGTDVRGRFVQRIFRQGAAGRRRIRLVRKGHGDRPGVSFARHAGPGARHP